MHDRVRTDESRLMRLTTAGMEESPRAVREESNHVGSRQNSLSDASERSVHGYTANLPQRWTDQVVRNRSNPDTWCGVKLLFYVRTSRQRQLRHTDYRCFNVCAEYRKYLPGARIKPVVAVLTVNRDDVLRDVGGISRIESAVRTWRLSRRPSSRSTRSRLPRRDPGNHRQRSRACQLLRTGPQPKQTCDVSRRLPETGLHVERI